jgi:hypothetical protein
MPDPHSKTKHESHRRKNLIAKHLQEERNGLYKLRVIPPKEKYTRKKLKPKDIDLEETD